MAQKTLICFDASIRQGKVGIGIYDSSNNRKIFKSFALHHKKFQSDEAERMAMIATLQYIQEFDIKLAHIFTDNSNVYNEGINKKLQKKYCSKMNAVELHWIPRQFNQEADRLSKKGSEVNKTPINNLIDHNLRTEKTGLIIVSKGSNTKKSTSKGTKSVQNPHGLNTKIKKFSLEVRFNLLKRMAITQYQMNFLEMVENKESDVIPYVGVDMFSDDYKFIQFIFTIIKKNECKNLELSMIANRPRPNLSNKNLEKLIRDRELI